LIADHIKMFFRLAMSPDRLGWTPEVFWKSTAQEFEMATEGLSGRFGSQPAFSREEIRRIAAAHGKRRSLRENPNATILGASVKKESPHDAP
jgi:hypothetical protein